VTVTRTFSCNLCREKRDLDALVGLHWSTFPKGWAEKPAIETENHICLLCISDIQAMKQRCGQGYECRGGPNCGSDHK
jgi:hypothetical protein